MPHARSCLKATTFETSKQFSPIARSNAKRLRALGVCVRHSVDARKLGEAFLISRFQFIIFQFPNVASRRPLFRRNPNHVLLRCFLRSAKEVLRSDGKIAVSVIDSPHDDGAFAMAEAAQWAGLCQPAIHPFDTTDHPDYKHVNIQGDEASALGPNDQLQTYVFQKRS